jgi:hypothetical protein
MLGKYSPNDYRPCSTGSVTICAAKLRYGEDGPICGQTSKAWDIQVKRVTTIDLAWSRPTAAVQ